MEYCHPPDKIWEEISTCLSYLLQTDTFAALQNNCYHFTGQRTSYNFHNLTFHSNLEKIFLTVILTEYIISQPYDE